MSFKLEANLAGQVSRVQVYGWDVKNQKQIVGIASAREESGLYGQSPRQRAKVALNERAKQFLTGEDAIASGAVRN